MGRNFGAYSSLGFIFSPEQQCFVLNSCYTKSQNVRRDIKIKLGDGIIGRIGTEGHSFMSGDLVLYNQDVQYYGGTEIVNSIIAVPVVSHNKELLGALVIDSKNKNVFTDQHKDAIKRFSRLTAALISNARMRIYQEKTATRFRIFYEASQRFSTALTTLEVLDILMKIVPSLTPARRIMIILFDQRKKGAFIFKISGEPMELQERLEFPLNEGIYSYALKTRNIVNIGDFQQAQGKFYRFVPDEPHNPVVHSLIALPLIDDESRSVGVLSIESDQDNHFQGDMEQILSILVFNASIAFSKALLYQKMEMLATTDGLTELNNHRHFQELLAQEIARGVRYSRPVSLLIMDIDHFKTFNDTYGHPVGDLVLKEISGCIRRSIRINDLPARYGGEEFAVIIPESDQNGAKIIAERIRRTIEGHIVRSLERELRVTVSIGYATLPLHAATQIDLIDCADKALYHSKETGRNRISEFEKGMKGKEKKA
jgi:diguanylate cyclase (GGDEF)-like protein